MDWIERYKIICICRRLYGDDLLNLTEALCAGGIRLMEVTFDQADPDCLDKTAAAIRALGERFESRMLFGAGTVLTTEQVDVAAAAGAQYIISPNVNLDVIHRTKELGLVSIPGALTPSEILLAHEHGADCVKLFPAGWLGLSYLRDILAPISHVKLVATAGVSESNLAQYLDMGVIGAGISGRLTDRALIAAGDFEQLKARAASMMAIATA